MIAELQQAVANYAHALDELNVSELEAILTKTPPGSSRCPDRECSVRSPDARRCSTSSVTGTQPGPEGCVTVYLRPANPAAHTDMSFSWSVHALVA